MCNQKQLRVFLLVSIALLSSLLYNLGAYGSDIPKTPEALFKEIIKKLETNDMANVGKHFAPSQQNKDTFTKMKPASRKRFAEGLKKARFSKKIDPQNLVYIVPYEDQKKKLDLEMTVMQMPDGQWIVANW